MMRPLTLKEMLLVSGGDQTDNLGTVTVTPDYDWDYDPWAGWDDPADDYYNYPENGGQQVPKITGAVKENRGITGVWGMDALCPA